MLDIPVIEPSFSFFFQGLPTFLEEGRYEEIDSFNVPASPLSIKLIKDDMGSPELYLASSTNYKGTVHVDSWTYKFEIVIWVWSWNVAAVSVFTLPNWLCKVESLRHANKSFLRTYFTEANMEQSPWEHADLNVQLMKYVSVGPAGIFASQAKDESVWCRFNLSNGKPTTKVAMDKKGDGWNKIANVSFLTY